MDRLDHTTLVVENLGILEPEDAIPFLPQKTIAPGIMSNALGGCV